MADEVPGEAVESEDQQPDSLIEEPAAPEQPELELVQDNSDLIAAQDGDDEGRANEGEAVDSEGAPNEYVAFDMLEGVSYSESEMAEAATVFQGLNLNQEQAQQLVTLESERAIRNAEHSRQALATLQETWANEIRKDSDLGGNSLKASNQIVTSALRGVPGGADLLAYLEQTGQKQNPHIFRFLHAVGLSVGEDAHARGGGQGSSEDERWRNFYKNTGKQTA